jgi:uncharacterized protein with ATP-grasp and redox domains
LHAFDLPPLLVDPATLPPLLLTSEPGSFAHNTLKVRVPGILQETIALNNAFPDDIRGALEELYAELTGGLIRGLQEDAADRAFWEAVSAPYVGRSWLDVPWYWAEAFFYRRILEATRYFQPGPWRGFDPFAAKKQAEWAPDAAPRAVELLLQDLPSDPARRFERLLHASLWGNRADLSYMVAAHLGGTADSHHERSNLVVDDTEQVWRFLQTAVSDPKGLRKPFGSGNQVHPCHIAIIADNAGTELLMDLALIDFLLAAGLAGEVRLHLKPQPFFVSDAMAQDVSAGLRALAGGGEAARALGERLQTHQDGRRLQLYTHWHYTTSLFYFQLPADLREELAAAGLVLVKGDANYRRLLGDAHWPPTTPFADAVSYLPAPLAALRTFKGEIIVGLRPGEAERLSAEDPAWLVNGRRGVIQARL